MPKNPKLAKSESLKQRATKMMLDAHATAFALSIVVEHLNNPDIRKVLVIEDICLQVQISLKTSPTYQVFVSHNFCVEKSVKYFSTWHRFLYDEYFRLAKEMGV